MLDRDNIYNEFAIFSSDEENMFSDVITDIAAELTTFRMLNKLTQHDLAGKLGKQQAYISKLENGEKNLSLKTLAEISVKLGGDLKISLGIADYKEELEKYENFYDLLDTDISKNQEYYSHINQNTYSEHDKELTDAA